MNKELEKFYDLLDNIYTKNKKKFLAEQILNDLKHVIDYKMKYNSISSYDVVIEGSKEALEYSSKYRIDYDTELRSYPEKFKLYDNYVIKGGK